MALWLVWLNTSFLTVNLEYSGLPFCGILCWIIFFFFCSTKGFFCCVKEDYSCLLGETSKVNYSSDSVWVCE